MGMHRYLLAYEFTNKWMSVKEPVVVDDTDTSKDCTCTGRKGSDGRTETSNIVRKRGGRIDKKGKSKDKEVEELEVVGSWDENKRLGYDVSRTDHAPDAELNSGDE